MPALNEEANLEEAVKGLCFLLEKETFLGGFEVLIIDDGSKDKTGEIAEKLTKENPRIRVFHNGKNMGLGYNFRKGAELARGEYVTWFPGDGENLPEPVINALKHIGNLDLAILYTANSEVRPLIRRILSFCYTFLNNFLFGLNLRYYNGLSVYRRDLLMKIPFWTKGHACFAEILLLLLKSGATYKEIPAEIKPVKKSAALKLKNIAKVIATICSLVWRINIKKERIKI